MPPLEKYLERADELVQEVYNAYGAMGNDASLTPEFSALVDKAHEYRTLSRVADNHREHNVLTEQKAADVQAARQTFAEAYKSLWEKYEMPSSAELRCRPFSQSSGQMADSEG